MTLKTIQMGDQIPKDVSNRYRDETHRILSEAKQQGISLRLLGAQAIREHCPKFGYLLDELGRSYLDLDFVALGEWRTQLKQCLAGLDYEIDRQILIAAEGTRYIFRNRTDGLVIDVFIDCLDFCHRINLRDRLSLDYPTIPLADLLLSKLQIVEIAERDLQDILVLILEHEIAESNNIESIDARYITTLLATDWGFYYTVNQNLNLLKSFLPACDWVNDKTIVSEQVKRLQKKMEMEEKTLSWKLRSKIGTKIKWYKQVSERGPVF
jgi:hypothetical protein